MGIFVIFHIAAGTVGLLAGAMSLALRKGSRPHRLWGRTFCVAMLLMSGSSVYLAWLANEPDNVLVGSLTFYLVGSGWMAVRGPRTWSWRDASALCAVLAVVATGAVFGLEAAISPGGSKDGVAAPDLFFVSAIAAAFLISDARRLVRRTVSNRARLLRHVWRMGFAMFIATLSFFFGQAQVLPDWLRAGHLNLAPVFAIAAVVVAWLVRLRYFEQANESERTTGRHECTAGLRSC